MERILQQSALSFTILTFVCLFWSAWAVANSMEAQEDSKHSFEVGPSLQILLPNRLPDLEKQITGYGPRVALPIGGDALQFQFLYSNQKDTFSGVESSINVYLWELNYRLNSPTPFFAGFFTVGGHALLYTTPPKDYFRPSLNVGTGFSIQAAKRLKVELEMKFYFQSRVLVNFGGAFLYLI